jgi:membrane associated rhomboid family serine protease
VAVILPIGHEDGTVSRRPWVTFALVAACFVAHFLVVGQAEVEERVTATWLEAADYAAEHPELAADPRLLDPTAAASDRPRPAARGADPADQAYLDALTARWTAELARHPLLRFGLVPANPTPRGLFAHMFLHGGWLHLLGNLLILYLAAPMVEDLWGHWTFAGFYLAAGVFAGGLYALQHSTLEGPLVGASGAVAGVLGAFLVVRGRSRIRFAVFLGFVATFTAPAWVMLPLWFGRELLDALANEGLGRGGGVAYWAHVWGFVFGAGFALAMRRLRPELAFETATSGAMATAVVAPADPRLVEARRLLDRGLYPRAWELLAAAAAEPRPDEEALATFWHLACHLSRQDKALAAGRELARRQLALGRWEEAITTVDELAAAGAAGADLAPLRLRAAEVAAAAAPVLAMRLLHQAAGDAASPLPPAMQARADRLATRLAAPGTTPAALPLPPAPG